ncbi:MAG: hypothetical protein ACREQC_08995, partial [Candidatus Binataceae bacterium]
MRPAYPLAIAILCAVLPLATVQKIAAHDLVLIPAGPNTLTLKFGHPQEYEAPNREKLIKLDLYLAGDEPPVSILSGVTKSTADYPTID